jgi:hypothetical protein
MIYVMTKLRNGQLRYRGSTSSGNKELFSSPKHPARLLAHLSSYSVRTWIKAVAEIT